MSSSSNLPPRQAFQDLADLFLSPSDEEADDPAATTEPIANADADTDARAIPLSESESSFDAQFESGTAPELESELETETETETETESMTPNVHFRSAPRLTLAGADDPEDAEDALIPESPHDAADCVNAAPGSARGGAPFGDECAAPARECATTMLVLCHLPVQARLWVNQIASRIARHEARGPLALLDAGRDDELAISLVGSVDPALWRMSDDSISRIQPASQIVPLFARLRPWVDRRLVLARPEEIVQLMRRAAPADQSPDVVLATSADPAAMVSVYRTIKMISHALASSKESMPAIRVLFIGTDEPSARHAFARLESATQGYLHQSIIWAGAIQRMQPIEMTPLGRFASAEFDERVKLIRTAFRAMDAARPNESAFAESSLESTDTSAPKAATPMTPECSTPRRQSPTPAPASTPRHQDFTRRSTERSAGAPHPAFDSSDSADQFDPCDPFDLDDLFDVEIATTRAARDHPRPARPGSAVAADRARSDDARGGAWGTGTGSLIQFMPGLIDLVARSPKAPEVELAIDAEGRIHALLCERAVRDADGAGNKDGEAGERSSVARLLAVCDWIEDHASMLPLLRTVPDSISDRFDREAASMATPRTVAHLFTPTPRRYRRMMDGRLRIHLLAPAGEVVRSSSPMEGDAEARSDHSWVHVEIN